MFLVVGGEGSGRINPRKDGWVGNQGGGGRGRGRRGNCEGEYAGFFLSQRLELS